MSEPALSKPMLAGDALAARRSPSARTRFAEGTLRGFTTSLREHILLIAVIGLHLAAGVAIPVLLGRDLHFAVPLGSVVEAVATLTFWIVLVAAIAGFAAAAIRHGDRGPLASAWRWLRDDFLRGDRIWGGVIVMGLFPIFAWNFAFIEALIPVLHHFTWDQTFAAWDRWLHFGRDPWQWLQPVLGFPIVTSLLSDAYASWFFVLYAVTVAQAFTRRDPVTRMQYLLCATLIWAVVGNLFGTLLASAGPEYFGRVTGLADPFQPLMDYLRTADQAWPVYTMRLQEKMWQLYLVNGADGVVNGNVTAMPSLHVATAFGFYLIGRTMHPVLGWALGAFAVIILIATVHLGWHYAIDGYAGILGTWLLWWACGKLVRWPRMMRLLWGGDPVRYALNSGAQ